MMKMIGLTALVLVLASTTVHAELGVDVSAPVYPATWKCMRSNGYTWTAIRAWHSYGAPDTNAPHTIYNAWLGGMTGVDVYLFPDTSKSAAGQVKGMSDYLATFNITNNSRYGPPHTYGRLWLDIEGPGTYWGSDHGTNQAFISDLISEAESLGIDVAIYTSESQWTPIVGDWDGGSSKLLWYANYDGAENFDDFRPFGGWSSPYKKQYSGSGNVCGSSVDLDWSP